MEKNHKSNGKSVYMISGIIGMLLAVMFINGFCLLCVLTFHEGYQGYAFYKAMFYIACIGLFLILCYSIFKMWKKKKSGETCCVAGNIKRIVIGSVAGFIVSYIAIGLVYMEKLKIYLDK